MKAPVKSSASSSPATSKASAKKEEATALFALLEEHEHEQVSLVYEPSTGYRGIMDFIKAETDHVTGLIGKSGDPSPVTAFGTYRGMKACARHRYGDDSLRGKTVAIQGCGHVGYYLADLLYKEGAQLIATDIDPVKLKAVVDDFRASPMNPDDIYGVDANIFAPCALGGIINDQTLGVLRVEIVAGAANNQL